MTTVTIDDPPRMNLLGLILANIMERNLANDPDVKRRFEKLAADVVVRAGEMVVTLKFGEGGVRVKRGMEGKARAQVSGSLDALVRMALGGGMVGPVIAGRLKPKGSLLLLLRLRRLLRVN